MAKRILVVDDEPKLLRAIAVTLRAESYVVTTAGNGADALISINQAMPDLIISDIRMPRIDGYQLARTLRSEPRTELIPIIFLTAKDEREARIAGFRTGVDAYLTKPFDPEELLAVIGNILSRTERLSAGIARLFENIQTGEPLNSKLTVDEDLTEAEKRVARLVANGSNNKEIAVELRLSVRTVEGHISNILSKKGWSNRVEIARFILSRDDF